MESNYFPPTEKEAKETGVTSSERRNAGFPSRLRQLRNKKGESQATLAKELMVTKSTISLYETGDNVPDARTIRRMAEHFDVSTDYLLGLANDPTPDLAVKEICEYIGLTSKTVEALHNISDDTGFMKKLLEDIIAPFYYKKISPIEKTLTCLCRSAVAMNEYVSERPDINNDEEDFWTWLSSKKGVFYKEGDKYIADSHFVATTFLEEATREIDKLISMSICDMRDDIAKQIKGKPESEALRLRIHPWSEIEGGEYGQ